MNNPNKNWDCQNDRCTDAHSEVRLLPAGGDSNMILCRSCFEHEIRYRKSRNNELAQENRFALPKWEDLKTYEAGA